MLAVCSVPDIRQALADRTGGRVYVCNLRPQEPETSGYDAAGHLASLMEHGVVVDTVIYDPSTAAGTLSPAGRLLWERSGPGRVQVVAAQVAAPDGHSHDPALLAAALNDLVSGS